MRLIPNKDGFVKNSVSTLSILAFITALSSFVAIEFFYNPSTKTNNSIKDKRTAYLKELEALPVEPGQGSAYFSLSTSENITVGKESTLNVTLINAENKSINAFLLVLFVPESLELISKPEVTLLSKSVVNYVEYIPVSGGTKINIFAGAKPDTLLTSEINVPVISFNFIPKNDGEHLVKFLKLVPSYPEIVDLTEHSLLDISVLNDLPIQVVKPTALTPVIKPGTGTYINPTSLTITAPSLNSKVKYTVDNTDPRTSSTAVILSSFPAYINIDKRTVISAYSYGDLYKDSGIVTETYDFSVAPLLFSLSNTSNLSDVLYDKVSSGTNGAKFYYSTKTPVEVIPENLVPSSGVLINKYSTYYFIGVKDGYVSTTPVMRTYSYLAADIKFYDDTVCNTSGILKCTFNVLDSSKTDLSITVGASLLTLIPTNLKITFTDSAGVFKEYLGIKDPNKPTIFTVTVTNYKNFNNSTAGIISVNFSNGLVQERLMTLDFKYAPLLTKFESVTFLDTYSSPSFKVSASSVDLMDKIYLYKKDLSNGSIIEAFSAYLNKSSITDYVVEDKNYVVGKYTYWVMIQSQNTLQTTSKDLDINIYEKGDVNKDFKLDIPNDLFAIIKAIFGSITPNIESMDINLDTKVDPLDIIKLLKKLFI